MALTVLQAEGLKNQQTFLDRVEYALIATCIAVAGESTGVTNHAARAAKASTILNNIAGYTPIYARGIITQLNLSTVSLTTGGADCDATDATLANACSAVYNWYL
jgi:hypothetical protein